MEARRYARGVGHAVVLLASTAASGSGQGAEPPRVVLEGRESVERMQSFEPFLERWTRVESPPGTRIEEPDGGCVVERSNHGMTVDVRCGPWDTPAEAARVYWHPADRELVFRIYSVFFPADLLFQGFYEFPTPNTIERTYRGYYGDGRIQRYRDVWRLETPDRLVQRTERFMEGEWTPIFGGSVFQRDGSDETADPLSVLDFYVGTIVPSDRARVPFSSGVTMERGVGGNALRFVGRWERSGEPPEFVNGLIGWDPVDEEIRITGIFYHGAYFSGRVNVLDRERRIVRREWQGRYPDGQVVPYRETWTPVSDDEFEWKIEVLRDGEWRLDLHGDADEPPIHRVIRAADVEGADQRPGGAARVRPMREIGRMGRP